MFFRNSENEKTILINTIFNDNSTFVYPHQDDSLLFYFVNNKGSNIGKVFYISYDGGETVSEILTNANSYLFTNPLNNDILFAVKNHKELWRSDDRGTNWYKIFTFDKNFYTLDISKTDTSLLYATVFNGIRRSTNSGVTWESVWDQTGTPTFSFYQLKIHPSDNEIVFVEDFHIYKFSFKTRTLTKVTDFGPLHGVNGFALHPSDTSTIFIAGSHPNFPGETIFKTNDEGMIWQALSVTLPFKPFVVFDIYLDHRDPAIIYADVYEGGIVKSTDGGVSWERTNFMHDRAYQMDLANYDRLLTGMAIWGMGKTDDEGRTWQFVEIQPDSLRYKKPDYLAMNPFNRNEGFLTINHKLLKTTNSGESFIQQNIFEGWSWLKYNPYFENIIYGIVWPGYSTQSGVFKSTDGGVSWVLNSLVANPKSFSPHNVNKLYSYGTDSQGNGVLFISYNGGTSWTMSTSGLKKYSGAVEPLPVSAVLESHHDSNIVYCGQWGEVGSISKSTNGGASWFQIDSNFPETNKYVHCMLLDKNRPGRFYVGAQTGLYLTENDGQTWRKLFDKNVYDLMMDNSQPPNIYVNTHAGILKLVDTVTVDVNELPILQPEHFVLYQNYPNPFNPSTKIKFTIPRSADYQSVQKVTLKIYDILGREVATLVNEELSAGEYEVEFNAKDLSSGIYFYQLTSGSFNSFKKFVLMK